MKKVLLVLFMALVLIAIFRGTAIGAQQATAPNLADTIASIQQNINAAARFSYTWAKHGQYDNDKNTVYENYTFGPATPCHLTLIAHNQSTNKDYQANPADTSYDIDLSKSQANSIQAVPFDLLGWAAPTVIDPSNGDTITSPSSSYWQIEGLMYMWPGNPPALTSFNDGTGDPILLNDQNMAQRIATALNHAVELCGGQPAPKQLF